MAWSIQIFIEYTLWVYSPISYFDNNEYICVYSKYITSEIIGEEVKLTDIFKIIRGRISVEMERTFSLHMKVSSGSPQNCMKVELKKSSVQFEEGEMWKLRMFKIVYFLNFNTTPPPSKVIQRLTVTTNNTYWKITCLWQYSYWVAYLMFPINNCLR